MCLEVPSKEYTITGMKEAYRPYTAGRLARREYASPGRGGWSGHGRMCCDVWECIRGVYVCMCTCVWVCMRRVCDECNNVCVCMCMCVCVCVCACVCVCVCVCACVCGVCVGVREREEDIQVRRG